MEIWRPAYGLEDLYEVSSHGSVRRVAGSRYSRRDSLLRKAVPNNRGYLVLKVSIQNLQKTRTVHSLVAETFIGPRPFENAQINHKDGSKLNNHVDNLEWVTPIENVKHSIETGLKKAPYGGKSIGGGMPQSGELNYNARLSEHDVVDIIHSLNCGATGKSLAIRFGVSISLIHAIKKGRRWPHLAR